MRTTSRLLLLACVCIPCIACHHAEATADPTPPPTPIGHVLIYTDNSPGSILTAFVMNHVQRVRGYATRVTTTEADFIARLPEQAWASVVVATQYSSTQPGYRIPLEQYVNGGGSAYIETWKSSASPPTGNNVLMAPSATHIWASGHTARGYSSICQNAPELESPIPGYALCSFQGITDENTTSLSEPQCTALTAGEYAPLNCLSPIDLIEVQLLLLEFMTALKAAEDQLQIDLADCLAAYGPNLEAVPPDEGDPAELMKCQAAAYDECKAAKQKALRQYLVRKKIAEKEASTTPSE